MLNISISYKNCTPIRYHSDGTSSSRTRLNFDVAGHLGDQRKGWAMDNRRTFLKAGTSLALAGFLRKPLAASISGSPTATGTVKPRPKPPTRSNGESTSPPTTSPPTTTLPPGATAQ